MIDWEPISETALLARVEQGYECMTEVQKRLWKAIQIRPQKWQQHPYGDAGGGFWAVALIGQTVVWYNDVEDGFNRSAYTTYGTIDDYWRNDDELNITIQYVMDALRGAPDLLQVIEMIKKRA